MVVVVVVAAAAACVCVCANVAQHRAQTPFSSARSCACPTCASSSCATSSGSPGHALAGFGFLWFKAYGDGVGPKEPMHPVISEYVPDFLLNQTGLLAMMPWQFLNYADCLFGRGTRLRAFAHWCFEVQRLGFLTSLRPRT